jgi:hypothetical protein
VRNKSESIPASFISVLEHGNSCPGTLAWGLEAASAAIIRGLSPVARIA